MPLLVFGMHRSGTSLLARLMHMMGAYIGPPQRLLRPSSANPHGFWERTDVLALHDAVLTALGRDWYRVADCDLRQLQAPARQAFSAQARAIVAELDAHRPWLLKDPRLCVLFPLWRELLRDPVCVLIYRHPLHVAQSVHIRDGLPVRFGLALWECYTQAALTSTHGYRRVLIAHQQLIEQPLETVYELYQQLVHFGISGLRCPPEAETLATLDSGLLRKQPAFQVEPFGEQAAQWPLFQALENRTALQTQVGLSAESYQTLRSYEARARRKLTQRRSFLFLVEKLREHGGPADWLIRWGHRLDRRVAALRRTPW